MRNRLIGWATTAACIATLVLLGAVIAPHAAALLHAADLVDDAGHRQASRIPALLVGADALLDHVWNFLRHYPLLFGIIPALLSPLLLAGERPLAFILGCGSAVFALLMLGRALPDSVGPVSVPLACVMVLVGLFLRIERRGNRP